MPAIYSTRCAEPAQGAWLRRLLSPLQGACKFNRLPPLELRQTGKWSGFCEDRQFVPDGRVAVSSTKISFWNDEKLTETYLHECSHRLLEGRDVDFHGPEFLSVNLILLKRAAPSFELDQVVSKLSFYDCQDRPAALLFEPGWRSVVIDWALAVAAELASTELAAEDLAEVVCARWLVHIQELEEARQQAAQQVVAARKFHAAQKEKIESLQSSLFAARTFLIVGWLCFLLVVYFVLTM